VNSVTIILYALSEPLLYKIIHCEREAVVHCFLFTSCSQVCQDCSHSLTFLPILLTLILGLGLVVIVLFLNLGASPTFDSLLFFIQVHLRFMFRLRL